MFAPEHVLFAFSDQLKFEFSFLLSNALHLFLSTNNAFFGQEFCLA